MNKKFAQYLTTLITNDVESKMTEDSMGISSYECEKVEAALMADKFDDVEKWVDGKTKKHSESKNMSRVQFDPVSRRFSIGSVKWMYVKPLSNKNAIDEFAVKYNVDFPKQLYDILKANNGGRPPKRLLKTRSGEEVVFHHLLSFNKNDDVSIYDFMPFDEVKGAVPFAVEPAGNIFCLYKGGIYLYDHETGKMKHVSDTVSEMLNKMYNE